jgi:hypothetical protein
VIVAFLGSVTAGSVELVTGDLSQSKRALDNIKGKWSQVVGNGAKLTAEYDRNTRKDFLKEATLAGTLDKLEYELTTDFGGMNADIKLATTTRDGTTLEAEGRIADLKGSVNKLTATRAAKLAALGHSQDVDLEISHDVAASSSKIQLSSIVGGGIRAIGAVVTSGSKSSMSYEFEYDTTLTEGRTLSASVSPASGTGEIEYVDSATLDATITATVPLGGEPKLTVKRAFSF